MGEIGERITLMRGGRKGRENQCNSISNENIFSSVFAGEARNNCNNYHYRFW